MTARVKNTTQITTSNTTFYLFGFHHNFTKGTSNMKLCKVFMSIINDLILGCEVDMLLGGFFAEPVHDQIADSKADYSYLFHMFIRRFYKGILSYGAYII